MVRCCKELYPRENCIESGFCFLFFFYLLSTEKQAETEYLTLVLPDRQMTIEARRVLVTATSWSCLLGPKLRL